MERILYRRLFWALGLGVGFTLTGLVSLGTFGGWEPTTSTADQPVTKSDPAMVYESHEPVGWVFGRVVGFKGADKPLLRRPALPPFK